MGFFSSVGGLLEQYAAGQIPGGNVEDHFDQAAQHLPCSAIASGLAEAFRSGDTAPFAQMAAQLFANGNGKQQAGLLNTLLTAAGPQLLQSFLANHPEMLLASIIQGGQRTVSEEQASSVPSDEVQALAEHVHQHDPSIVDKVSDVSAQHPALIKSLGSLALGIAMRKISQSHTA